MITVNINEAKAQLSRCLSRVAQGETVVICKRNQPVAEIRSIRPMERIKRPIGLAGKEFPAFTLDQDFFAPLPEDIIDSFTI